MKKLLSFFFLLAIAVHAGAATKVSGILTANTTWTKANSPYILTGGLLVQHGVTLTIEPGVMVQAISSGNLWVEGKIVAVGTPADSIILTSQYAGDGQNGWRGINFRSTYGATEGEFQYCSIRNSIFAISTDTATTLTVKNCYFRAHEVAIYAPAGNFEVTNNRFEYCIALADNYVPGVPSIGVFKDNQINLSSYGMRLLSSTSEITVTSNSFYGCSYGIILLPVKKTSVKDNKILKCGVGMLAHTTQLQEAVQGNIFGYCREGLRVDGANGNFIHNSFKFNKTALVVNSLSPGFVFEYNCIDSSTDYHIVLNSTNDINVKNNWWGTTDSAKMHAASYDYDQNFTSGYISFGPYLSSQPTNCKAIPDTTTTPLPTYLPDITHPVIVSIYPNPVISSFTVQANNTATVKSIEVYNTVGTLLVNNTVSATQATIDMSAYTPGIYLYKIITANGQLHIGRIIKQ